MAEAKKCIMHVETGVVERVTNREAVARTSGPNATWHYVPKHVWRQYTRGKLVAAPAQPEPATLP